MLPLSFTTSAFFFISELSSLPPPSRHSILLLLRPRPRHFGHHHHPPVSYLPSHIFYSSLLFPFLISSHLCSTNRVTPTTTPSLRPPQGPSVWLLIATASFCSLFSLAPPQSKLLGYCFLSQVHTSS